MFSNFLRSKTYPGILSVIAKQKPAHYFTATWLPDKKETDSCPSAEFNNNSSRSFLCGCVRKKIIT